VTGSQREAINILMMMESVTVNADMIAQALGMNPGVLRQRVKEGTYKISDYDYDPKSGRIRFFRKDFLQKIGEMAPDPEERTDSDRMDELIELLRVQNTMMIELLAYTKKAAMEAKEEAC
jgi:hypothetical protein